jgi:UDP-N-acetylglucosamine acyltransferase
MTNIHATAIIEPSAEIADDAIIGPFCIIGNNVKIDSGSIIISHVNIEGNTSIGKNCKIFPHASLGTPPQDFKYKGEKTFLIIGDNNVIREYVTINRATGMEEWTTRIGSNNYFMAYSHVAHNSIIGNRVVIANAGTLAGHVHVEDNAIIGGLTGLHQFTRVGCYAIVGACSGVSKDVLPFSCASGIHARTYGLNFIGLRRHGFSKERIHSIKKAFRFLFQSKLNTSQALEKIQQEISNSPDVDHLVEFIKDTKRGICK